MTQFDMDTDRDGLLRQLLQLLLDHRVVRRWAESPTPYSDLANDCSAVASNERHFTHISKFLNNNPIIHLSVRTYFQQTIVASNARVADIPMPGRLLAHQGIWIGRWLQVF